MPSPGSMTRVWPGIASHPPPGSPLGPRRACPPAHRRPGWPTRRSCVRSWRPPRPARRAPHAVRGTCWAVEAPAAAERADDDLRTAGSRTAELVGHDHVPPGTEGHRHAVGRPLRKERAGRHRARPLKAAVRPEACRGPGRGSGAEPGLVPGGRPSTRSRAGRAGPRPSLVRCPRRSARACRWRSAAVATRDRPRQRPHREAEPDPVREDVPVGDDRLTQQRHAATREQGGRGSKMVRHGPPLAQRSRRSERREQVPGLRRVPGRRPIQRAGGITRAVPSGANAIADRPISGAGAPSDRGADQGGAAYALPAAEAANTAPGEPDQPCVSHGYLLGAREDRIRLRLSRRAGPSGRRGPPRASSRGGAG